MSADNSETTENEQLTAQETRHGLEVADRSRTCKKRSRRGRRLNEKYQSFIVNETHLARRQRDTKKRYLEPLDHLHHKALLPKNENDKKQIEEYFRSFSESREVPGPCENIVVKCKTEFRAYAEALLEDKDEKSVDQLIREIFFRNARIYAKDKGINDHSFTLDPIPKKQDIHSIATFGDLEIIRQKARLIMEQVPCLKQLKKEVPYVSYVQGVVFGMTWEPAGHMPPSLKKVLSLLITLGDVSQQRQI